MQLGAFALELLKADRTFLPALIQQLQLIGIVRDRLGLRVQALPLLGLALDLLGDFEDLLQLPELFSE